MQQLLTKLSQMCMSGTAIGYGGIRARSAFPRVRSIPVPSSNEICSFHAFLQADWDKCSQRARFLNRCPKLSSQHRGQKDTVLSQRAPARATMTLLATPSRLVEAVRRTARWAFLLSPIRERRREREATPAGLPCWCHSTNGWVWSTDRCRESAWPRQHVR